MTLKEIYQKITQEILQQIIKVSANCPRPQVNEKTVLITASVTKIFIIIYDNALIYDRSVVPWSHRYVFY